MRRVMLLSPVFALILIIRPPSSIDKVIMERGKKVYDQYCITCHQADGGGVPGLNPPLEKTNYVLGGKTKLIRIILKGSKNSVEIDGETYTNAMAPLDYLTNQQISDVLTYIRNSFGNKAIVVTPGDVKYVRTRIK